MSNKVNKPIFKRWWFWALVIILIIIAVPKGDNSGGITPVDKPAVSNNAVATPTSKPSTTPEPTKVETKITYENFIKIKMGAKLEEVNALIGEGQELSSSEIAGIKTAMYSWNGTGISNMNVTIQNGAVTGKAQMGLQSVDANVTMGKYNQVKEGMTYDQVKAILGEGQVASQTKLMDTESIIYEWINKDGSNMNGTFSDGKLMMKAQFNLK